MQTAEHTTANPNLVATMSAASSSVITSPAFSSSLPPKTYTPSHMSDRHFLKMFMCLYLPRMPLLLFHLINLDLGRHSPHDLSYEIFHWQTYVHTNTCTHVPFHSSWYPNPVPSLSHNTVYPAVVCGVQIPTLELRCWVSAECPSEICLGQLKSRMSQ